MCTTFEAIGILVHRRIAPFPLVQDLIGGITGVVWRRLSPWITELRVEQRKAEKVPAREQHRDWAP